MLAERRTASPSISYGRSIVEREELDRLLGRLRSTIERPYEIEGDAVRLSASIGLAVYPDTSTDPVELLRRADAMMYEIKRAKR